MSGWKYEIIEIKGATDTQVARAAARLAGFQGYKIGRRKIKTAQDMSAQIFDTINRTYEYLSFFHGTNIPVPQQIFTRVYQKNSAGTKVLLTVDNLDENHYAISSRYMTAKLIKRIPEEIRRTNSGRTKHLLSVTS